MKALVLSSGGVDSTTCLAVAIDKYGKENVVSLSIKYGQKHSKELDCAERIAKNYGVVHKVLDLGVVFEDNTSCTLLNGNGDIEHKSYAEQQEDSINGIVNTYVPFRNGLIVAAAASMAMSLFPYDFVELYLGAHSDDAAGNAYPDCSVEFTEHLKTAVQLGSGEQVIPIAPFAGLHKKDIVKKGLELGVPYELTWSCYEGNEKHCGTCGTCIDRKKAFEENNAIDPVPYEQ